LIWALPANATAAEDESAGSAAASARSAPSSAESRSRSARTERAGAVAESGPLRRLSRGRIELTAIDRLEALVHEPAIETCRAARTVDGNCVGLCALDSEARRHERRDLSIVGWRGISDAQCVRVALNVQRLKTLGPARSRQRSTRACGSPLGERTLPPRGRFCCRRRVSWRERELKIDALITRRRADGDSALHPSEPGEVEHETVGLVWRERDRVPAVDVARRQRPCVIARSNADRDARKRNAAARHTAVDATPVGRRGLRRSRRRGRPRRECNQNQKSGCCIERAHVSACWSLRSLLRRSAPCAFHALAMSSPFHKGATIRDSRIKK